VDRQLSRTYAQDDDGALVRVAVGEAFAVRLPENRTTGYRWQLMDKGDAPVALTGDDFVAPPDARSGATGEHVWHFSARATGEAQIRLVYARRWDSESAGKTFTLRVAIGS
jgi:inhibitor of cysteine peptidase